MNRLQKKCFVASTGFHLSLLVLLIVGPAFLASKHKADDDMPPLTFIPVMTTDDKVMGGGDPRASAPPAPPPAPAPANPTPPAPRPKPEPQELSSHEERQPEPQKEVVKPPKPDKDPDAFEPAKEPKPHKIEISTKAVTRSKPNEADKKAAEEAKEQARAEAQAREYAKQVAEQRRQMASALGGAANSLQNNRSGSTEIKFAGPGGGGVPYANFLQALKTIYDNAWILPDGVTDDNATVAVSVTIGRDGTVISSKVTRASGNVAVDQSVRATLRRVTMTVPLPASSSESERTVTINFNVAAKRGTG